MKISETQKREGVLSSFYSTTFDVTQEEVDELIKAQAIIKKYKNLAREAHKRSKMVSYDICPHKDKNKVVVNMMYESWECDGI